MQQLIDLSVPLLTVTLLTAVGLDLTGRDFRRIRRQPGVVLAGLIGPLVVLPPIAIAIARVFEPGPHVAASLLLIAACPIGGISNTYSYLARASPALSVALTGLSCLLAGATMPLLGRIFQLALGQPLEIDVPFPLIFGQFFLMLSVPVGVGMWLRHQWPDWAVRHRTAFERAAFVGVGIVLVLIILDDPGAFLQELPVNVPLAGLFISCTAAAGWGTAALVTRDARDRFTLAVEFGTRNLGVAMAVAVTLLGRIEFARFAYIYFLTEMPLMLAAIYGFRWQQVRGAAVQPADPPSV